jgi:hypothetical protein
MERKKKRRKLEQSEGDKHKEWALGCVSHVWRMVKT